MSLRKRTQALLLWSLFACVPAGAVAGATASVPLIVRLHTAERISEWRYEDDRVDWKLPERRLKRFRDAGVIINEDARTSSITKAIVLAVHGGVAHLAGIASVSSVDVPRQTVQAYRQPFTLALASNNSPLTDAKLPVEDAAAVMLPSWPVRLGQQWVTSSAVTTTLGSGMVTIKHTVESLADGLVEIAVVGRGEITGTEYHLPKLLPGTIELVGAAWYDPNSGLVTQESYEIHNRIIKPMEGEENGFDERLSVDVITRKT